MSECAETRELEHHSIASSVQIYYCQSAFFFVCVCVCVHVSGLMLDCAEYRPGQIGFNLI